MLQTICWLPHPTIDTVAIISVYVSTYQIGQSEVVIRFGQNRT